MSASRIQSPNKFTENTSIIRAIAGKRVIHQSPEKRNSLPTLISVPSEGVVGGIPWPRKLKVASAIMARARPIVAMTRTGRSVLGKICRKMIVIFGYPIRLAA